MMQRLQIVLLSIPIALLFLALQACADVVAWRVAGQSPQSAVVKSQSLPLKPLYFTLPQFKEQQEDPRAERRISMAMIQGIQDGLAESSLHERSIFSLATPDENSYCVVTIKRHGDLLAIMNSILTLLTLGTVPYYQEVGLYEVSYEFYKDRELKGRYLYNIDSKEFAWIFGRRFAPSVARSWGKDGWTGSQGEAFAETTRRFLREAYSAGVF